MISLPGKITSVRSSSFDFKRHRWKLPSKSKILSRFYKTLKGVLSKETTESKTEVFSAAGNFTMGIKTMQNTAFDTPIGGRGTKLGTNVLVVCCLDAGKIIS
jgi:hypothetical protein